MKNKSFFASCAIFGTIIMATTLLFSSKGNLFSGSVRADSCPHSNVEYHKAVEPSLIRHGHREYWCCCACHKSFSDPDFTKVIENTIGNPLDIGDGRQLPALGESYGENPTNSGTISSQLPPESTAFDTVYEDHNPGWNVFKNINISHLNEVAFCVKSTAWHTFIDNSWDYASGPNEWYAYKLVNNGDGWDIYRTESDLSTFSLKVENKQGDYLQDVFELNSDPCDFLVTNLRCINGNEFVNGEMAAESALAEPTLTTEINAPLGYKNVTKQTLTNADDLNNYNSAFLADIDIAQFEKVQFRFLTTNRYFCYEWAISLKTNVWNYAEVINNGDGTFASRIYDENYEYKFGYSGKTSFKDAIRYCHGGDGIPTWYSTEVLGILREDLKAPVGDIISNSAICYDISYQTLPTVAPEGYSYLNKVSVSGDRADTVHYAQTLVKDYDSLNFAIMVPENGYLLLDGWGAYVSHDTWVYVVVNNYGNNNYFVSFFTSSNSLAPNTNGAPFYTEYFDYSDSAGIGYVIGGLNTIMFKCCTYSSVATDNFYVTELRGVTNQEITRCKNIVDESAISGNGVSITKLNDVVKASGYENVYKISAVKTDDTSMHGMYYSDKELTDYQKVEFAIKTTGYWSFGGGQYGYRQNEWVYFELFNNSDNTFNLVVKDKNNEVLYSKNSMSSYKGENPGVYTNYSLNAILFGNADINPYRYESTAFVILCSEIRGSRMPVTDILVDNCAISANGIQMADSIEQAPVGFETVFEKNFNGDMHGQFYSNVPLTDYSEIYFGLKTTGTYNFNNINYDEGHDWLIFTLTNNGDGTFNLVVTKEDKTIVHQAANLGGFKGENPGVYTNYALNAILYGNPAAGYYPYGDTFTVYVTELRGNISGDLVFVENSTTDYQIVYENNRYIYNSDSPNNNTAVKLFKENLNRATGIQNITTAQTNGEVFSSSSKFISIGDTSLLRTSKAILGENLNGGYIIKTVGNSIFVYAENMGDYILAISDLMNLMFDYNYYSPSDIGVESKTNITLQQMKKIVVPSFEYRERIADNAMINQEHAAGLGYSAGYEWETTGQPHALCDHYLNFDSLYSSHPNWFSIGKDKWGDTQHQLCYSAHGSESEYEAMVDEVCNEIISDVNANSWTFDNSNNPTFTIDLSIQDNWYQCTCANCTAELSTYGSYAGQQLHFVNDIANQMDVWFAANRPNLKHSYKMLAYQQGQKAPTSVNYSLNENIEIQFAPVKIDLTKPLAPTGANSEHYNDLLAWVNLFNSCSNVSAENISVWYYSYSVHNIIPVYDYDAIQATFRNIHNLGIKKISNQFITNGTQLPYFQDLNLYLKAKLMENVDIDLNATAKEFIDNYYGSGSTKIYEFLQTMNSNMKNTYTSENTMFDTHNSKTYWSKTVVNKLISLCDEAIADVEANETDPTRKQLLIDRINRERCTPVYMLLEYNYASLFTKSTYKNFFKNTCAQFNITHVDTSTTVTDWLKSV